MRFWVLLLILGSVSDACSQATDPAWMDSLQAYWNRIEAEFRDADHSPLPAEAREHFLALERFPPDPLLRVTASFKAKAGKPFGMKTTTDRLPSYESVGTLHFKVQGRKQRLLVYRNIDLVKRPEYVNHLFVPFTDPTNGTTTYGGGRYIDLEGPLERKVELDFNRAYNPYCAYGGRYSCPIPPAENDLAVPIPAGVKAYAH